MCILYDPAVLLPGMYPMEWCAYIDEKIYMCVHAHSSNVYVNPKWKQHKHLSTPGWINKFRYIHAMQYYKVMKVYINHCYIQHYEQQQQKNPNTNNST